MGSEHTRARAGFPHGDHEFREAPIDEFSTDFGGLRYAVSRAVHRMPSAFPAALLGSGRQLTLRGAGHSSDGQTVTEGELLVTYAPEAAAPQVRDLGDGLIEVPAGMSWYGLERYLNRRSAAFPVLPDYLQLSVGGTLSMGGIGIDSVRSGMQVDHVERIQLIDGTGASRWCSRTDHSELFRFALGGSGTVGLIERAVLRTVPYRRDTHLHRTRHDSQADLVEHTERMAERDDIDIFYASIRHGVCQTVIGWRGSGPEQCRDEGCAIVADLSFQGNHAAARTAAPPPGHARLCTDYIVPAGQLAPMLAAVDALRHLDSLNRGLELLWLLIVRRSPEATAFPFTPAGSAPVSIGVGFCTSLRRELAAVAATRTALRGVLERCLELGGRPYLYGFDVLDAAAAEQLYGTDLPRLAQLRSAHRLEHVNAHHPLVRAALGHQFSDDPWSR
ncbi:FAD-binding protein [Nocardia beijingensis]|uniref:FAD-binding protein n=1 Tax=Nocardia beijingensis TaxID=95162 RepID=UPI00082C1DE9|nr:FAD-binding protein [Nocardia beijingensis]